MNRKVLLIATMAGLLAGLAVRALKLVPEPRFEGAMAAGMQDPPPGGEAAGGEWERRFSRYFEEVPPPAPADEGDPRSQADAMLRLLRQPVSAAAIEEGVELLNRLGNQRWINQYSAVFERWADAHPEAALAAAHRLRYHEARGALIYEVFRHYALDGGGGIDSALTRVSACPAGMARATAFKALAETLPADRIPGMLSREMSAGPAGVLTKNASFAAALLDRLFTLDPEAPLRLALALETDQAEWRTELLRRVMERNAESAGKDPKEWNETITRLAADPRNRAGIQTALNEMVATDPGRALGILATYPAEEARSIHRAWLAGVDPQLPRLLELGWTAEEQAQKIQSYQTVLDTVREREGTERFQALLAEAALSGGTGTLQAVSGWMEFRGDPAALDDLTRRATLADPFTTARWLAAMPPSAMRDRAVSVFAETHTDTDPARAALWAASIADPAMRESTLLALRGKAPAER